MKNAFLEEIDALQTQRDSLDSEAARLVNEITRNQSVIDFASAVRTILRHPELVSFEQLLKIQTEITAANVFRGQGDFTKVNERVARARQEILKTLLKLISQDIVSKTDYEQLKDGNKKLADQRDELSARIRDLVAANQKLQSEIDRLRSVLGFLFPENRRPLKVHSLRCEKRGEEKIYHNEVKDVRSLLKTGYFFDTCPVCKKKNKVTIDYLMEHLSIEEEDDDEEEEGEGAA